jgi:hypothetical protein
MLSGSLLEKGQIPCGNSLGLNAENGPAVNVLLLTYWANKENDEQVLDFMRNALKRVEHNVRSRKQLVPRIYWNYAFFY